MKKGAKLCENLCEKNFPKSAKIGKNRKKRGKLYLTNSITYNNLRRLGNSEVVTGNPRVGCSILSLGTIIKSSRVIALELFVFGVDFRMLSRKRSLPPRSHLPYLKYPTRFLNT